MAVAAAFKSPDTVTGRRGGGGNVATTACAASIYAQSLSAAPLNGIIYYYIATAAVRLRVRVHIAAALPLNCVSGVYVSRAVAAAAASAATTSVVVFSRPHAFERIYICAAYTTTII